MLTPMYSTTKNGLKLRFLSKISIGKKGLFGWCKLK
nr:unnamed protein product [Callosobruchus analis]